MTTDKEKPNHINANSTLAIPEQLERALGYNVTRLASLFKKELLIAVSYFEMTAEQWEIMATLWWTTSGAKTTSNETQALTQVEICQLTLKDKPTVSRMIDVMMTRGWVKKVQSEYDARKNYVVLTAKGKTLREDISKKLMSHFSPILSHPTDGLTPDEHATLLRLLKKARRSFGD